MIDALINERKATKAPALPERKKGLWRWRYPVKWSVPGLGPVHLGLLLFLVLFLDVKLAIKIPVLALAFFLQPATKRTRIPLFYPLILGLAALDWICYRWSAPAHYDLVAALGLFFWLLCLGAAIQTRRFAENIEPGTIHRTLVLFFFLNVVVSLVDVGRIAWEIKDPNPYLYQGMFQHYFIRTGDYINGLTFDTSTTNALINAFGVVYFLSRRMGWMMLVCMVGLLLTGSNFTNMLLLGVLAWLFAFRSDREQKSGIILCVLAGVVFLGKVSPQNVTYVERTVAHWERTTTAARPDPWDLLDLKRTIYARHYLDSTQHKTILDLQARIAERKRDSAAQRPVTAPIVLWTGKPHIPVPNIDTPPYQSQPDTTPEQRRELAFVDLHRASLERTSMPKLPAAENIPGKILALGDVLSFWGREPQKVLTGDGPGNFSSKLAFRATGLDLSGKYPARWTYIHPDFLKGNLDLYLAYFTRPKEVHSLVNSPDSVFAQMGGEYGILGLGLFVWGYLGFFVQRIRLGEQLKGKRYAYGLPLLVLMTGAFFIGYWFEQLSLVVLFELMIYLDCTPVFKTVVS